MAKQPRFSIRQMEDGRYEVMDEGLCYVRTNSKAEAEAAVVEAKADIRRENVEALQRAQEALDEVDTDLLSKEFESQLEDAALAIESVLRQLRGRQ